MEKRTKRSRSGLALNRETLRALTLLTTTELGQVVAGTCWFTVALPCNDQGDSATGCVSGNLCAGGAEYGTGIDPNG